MISSDNQEHSTGHVSAISSIARVGMVLRILDMSYQHLKGRKSFGKKTLHHRYVSGCSLIGDAFVTLIVSNTGDGVALKDIDFQVFPEFYEGLSLNQDTRKKFYDAHNDLLEKTMITHKKIYNG